MRPFAVRAFAVTCWLSAAALGAQDTLTVAQRDTLDRGGHVVLSRERPGSPWPAVTVYVLIDASPEEATAVFTDYDAHSGYIPSVKQSRISRTIDAATSDVDYVVALPIVSDERYTVQNRVSVDAVEGGYRVDWTLVRASTTKATVGHARFLPYRNTRTGRAGTLLEYFDFVTPGSRIASMGFIRKRALREMAETALAVGRRAELMRNDPDALRARVSALRSSVPRTSGGT